MEPEVSSSFDSESFRGSLAEALAPGHSLLLESDTRFRHLQVWDSIASVSIVAMVYARHDVQISGEELMACETVGAISDLVAAKLAAAGSAS